MKFERYKMPVYHFLMYIASFLTLAYSQTTYGQTPSDPSKTVFWLNGGLGLSSLGSLAGVASFSVQVSQVLVSLRTTANSECVGLACGGDEFFDLGVLIGIASIGKKTHISVAAGFARVTGSRYIGQPGFFGKGKRIDIDSTIGFPVEVQLFKKHSGVSRLGLYVFSNINSERSFGGIALCLQFGKLN